MKMLADKILLIVVFFVLSSCGSASVTMNKYIIDEIKLQSASSLNFKDKVITISSVKQSSILKNTQIPYKLNNVRLQYFVADSWASRVDDLVKRRLFDALKSSNMFLDVYDGNSIVESDYEILVYLDYLGEELIGNQRYATTNYDLRIIDKENKTIYFEKIESKNPINCDIESSDYVSVLVEKISENISSTIDQSLVKFYNSVNK